MTLALYRKYRPATFAEVVGQEHVTQPLSRALESGRINHAYLFSGPRGCGKTSSARILARSLNCELGPTPEPCGVCPSCVSLAPGGPGNIDVTELDAASHGGVDDTRELRDRAFFAPAESRYRVFIVDEAHMITTQGFNALLKIVEEPPEHLVFVFATTEPEKVLPTIRSRTHHYPFRLIPPGTLRSLLERVCAEEDVTVAPAVYPLVIRAGGGSARDSLSVLDQLVAGAGDEGVTYERAVALLGVSDVALIDDVVDGLAAGDRAAVFEAVDRLVEAGHDPRRFATDLLQRFRDLTLVQAVPEAAGKGLVEAADDEIARMFEQAGKLGAGTLTRYGEILHAGLVEMRGATAPRLLLELLCARMLLPSATPSEAGLLERIERLERRNAIAVTSGTGEAEPPARTFGRPSAREAAVGDGQGARAAQPDGEAGVGPASPPAPASAGAGASGGGPGGAERGRGDSPVAGEPSGGGRAAGRAGGDAGAGSGPDAGRAGSRAPGGAGAGSRADAGRTGAGVLGADGSGAGGATVGAGGEPAATVADGGGARETRPAASSAGAPGAAAALDAAAVRRVWPEILSWVKDRKKRTAALLVSATVRVVEGDTLVLAIGTAPLARMLSEPSNLDVIADALNAVLGVRWRVRCEHGDGGGAPPDRRAAPRASGRAGGGPEPARAPAAGDGRPDAGAAGPPDGGRGAPARRGGPPRGDAPGAGRPERDVRTPTRGAPRRPGGSDHGEPLPPEPPDDDVPPEDAGYDEPPDPATLRRTPPPGGGRAGAAPGSSPAGVGAGDRPPAGPAARGPSAPGSSAPGDLDDDEEALAAEAAHGPAPGAAAVPPQVLGPEAAALELLTAQLGARAIDRR